MLEKFIVSLNDDLQKKINSLLGENTNKPPTIKQDKLFSNFHLPITYLEKYEVFPLSDTVSNDLELVVSQNTHSMYEYLFKPQHSFAKSMIPEWNKQYTTNIDFLNDSKNVLESMKIYRRDMSYNYSIDCSNIMEIWNATKNDNDFLAKHCYIEWDFLKHFNESQTFLQCLSGINIASPLFSLLVPFIFLLFPFLILKLQNKPITFDIYMDVLKTIAKHHFIGKAITNMTSLSPDKIIYILFTFGLYLLQVYQNTVQCQHFYKNIHKVNNYLLSMKEYSIYSIQSMEKFLELNQNKKTYTPFIVETRLQYENLIKFKRELDNVRPFNHSFSKLSEMGYLLKCFYKLHSNIEYENALRYSFGFEGYINNLLGVYENLENGIISYATFDKNSNCEIKEQCYPVFRGTYGSPGHPLPFVENVDSKPESTSFDKAPVSEKPFVKNNCSFEKNMIISSPNAGGKTTMIKTTTINIIFSQQIGCGFYKSCVLNPYTHIHSYLNIPDTSGRDSLFQAESRRCKEIIDIISEFNQENKYRHFCIFDELYSGTNPIEATKSAYAFLLYLSKLPNVNFILTTHYVAICKKFKNSDKIQNYKMEVENKEDGGLIYTYKMKKGISTIQGAVKILQQMNYPEEIIETIRNYK
jgi:hypothetical protein